MDMYFTATNKFVDQSLEKPYNCFVMYIITYIINTDIYGFDVLTYIANIVTIVNLKPNGKT
jgi:hypothetical protein